MERKKEEAKLKKKKEVFIEIINLLIYLTVIIILKRYKCYLNN